MGRRYKSSFEQKHHIYCYDNGGKTADRYTVVYLNELAYDHSRVHFEAVGMSADPFHPQGFGQHCSAMTGRHLGKRIDFFELPPDCQKLVRQDLQIT